MKTFIIIIGGLYHLSGSDAVLDVLSTAPLSASLTASIASTFVCDDVLVHTAIQGYPVVSSTRMKVLDTVSSDSGWSASINATSALRSLLDFEAGTAVYDADGIEVYLRASITASDLTIPVTDTMNISTGDIIYIDGEAMRVTSAVAADSVDVTRGWLGTSAVEHINPRPGFVVWSSMPSPSGFPVMTYLVEHDATVLPTANYNGILENVSSDSTASLNLSVGSAWVRMMGRPFNSPIGSDALNPYKPSAHRLSDGRIALYSGTTTVPLSERYADLTHVSLTSGDYSVIFEATEGAMDMSTNPSNTADGGVYYWRRLILGEEIGWCGKDRHLMSGRVPEDWENGPVDVQWVVVLNQDEDLSLDGLMQGLLTGTLPSGVTLPTTMHAHLLSDQVGDLSTLVSAHTTRITNHSLLGLVLSPPQPDDTWIDYVSREILAPFGCGLSIGDDGRVHGVHWGLSYTTTQTITRDDLASDNFSSVVDPSRSLASVTLEYHNHTMRSRVSEAYSKNGISTSVESGTIYDFELLRSVWYGLMASLEISPRVVKLSCVNNVRSGEVVSVDIMTLPSRDGSVDVAWTRGRVGRVMEVTSHIDTGVKDVTISFIGGNYEGEGAVWAASLVVDGAHIAGSLMIACLADEYVLGDAVYADDFAAMDDLSYGATYLTLCDQYLTPKSDNAVKYSGYSGNDLYISGAFKFGGVNVALSDGDIIRISDSDFMALSDVENAEYYWFANSSGLISTSSTSTAGRKYV